MPLLLLLQFNSPKCPGRENDDETVVDRRFLVWLIPIPIPHGSSPAFTDYIYIPPMVSFSSFFTIPSLLPSWVFLDYNQRTNVYESHHIYIYIYLNLVLIDLILTLHVFNLRSNRSLSKLIENQPVLRGRSTRGHILRVHDPLPQKVSRTLECL